MRDLAAIGWEHWGPSGWPHAGSWVECPLPGDPWSMPAGGLLSWLLGHRGSATEHIVVEPSGPASCSSGGHTPEVAWGTEAVHPAGTCHCTWRVAGHAWGCGTGSSASSMPTAHAPPVLLSAY